MASKRSLVDYCYTPHLYAHGKPSAHRSTDDQVHFSDHAATCNASISSDDHTDTDICDMPNHPIQKQHKRHVPNSMKKIVAAEQKWCCNICQELLDATYEVDHRIPLWNGGKNNKSNLQALCPSCHAKKTYSENAKHEIRKRKHVHQDLDIVPRKKQKQLCDVTLLSNVLSHEYVTQVFCDMYQDRIQVNKTTNDILYWKYGTRQLCDTQEQFDAWAFGVIMTHVRPVVVKKISKQFKIDASLIHNHMGNINFVNNTLKWVYMMYRSKSTKQDSSNEQHDSSKSWLGFFTTRVKTDVYGKVWKTDMLEAASDYFNAEVESSDLPANAKKYNIKYESQERKWVNGTRRKGYFHRCSLVAEDSG
jgi:5-methylcytosine-specific restriction endonuclease McrA